VGSLPGPRDTVGNAAGGDVEPDTVLGRSEVITRAIALQIDQDGTVTATPFSPFIYEPCPSGLLTLTHRAAVAGAGIALRREPRVFVGAGTAVTTGVALPGIVGLAPERHDEFVRRDGTRFTDLEGPTGRVRMLLRQHGAEDQALGVDAIEERLVAARPCCGQRPGVIGRTGVA